MNALRCAAAALATLLGGGAWAAVDTEPPTVRQFRLECVDETCASVAVPVDTLRAFQQNNHTIGLENLELRAQLKAAQEQLEKMRAIKGCAKSEVTEPPKGPKVMPALPRERDS